MIANYNKPSFQAPKYLLIIAIGNVEGNLI